MGVHEQDSLDLFDDMIPKKSKKAETKSSSHIADDGREEEIRTSYLLVNVLLTLLIDKGIIHQGEVDELLEELFDEYKKKRRR
jgi:hypothetical protein